VNGVGVLTLDADPARVAESVRAELRPAGGDI
jgi:hypothetical protein